MEVVTKLREQFGKLISLEEVEPGVSRIYAPFFHEDGDMLSIYLQTNGDGRFILRDFGNTLMRVSYVFDIDTPHKQEVLSCIVKSNHGSIDDGELIMESDFESLPQTIMQYSLLVAKVSNIDILRRENVKTLFYEYLDEYMVTTLSKYKVQKFFAPTKDKQLVVDYRIDATRPFFVFGINENTKASKVVISCLNFQKQKIPFRSLIIHEDFESLSSFNRNQITNAADKQFTSLEDFKAEGLDYIEREIAS